MDSFMFDRKLRIKHKLAPSPRSLITSSLNKFDELKHPYYLKRLSKIKSKIQEKENFEKIKQEVNGLENSVKYIKPQN